MVYHIRGEPFAKKMADATPNYIGVQCPNCDCTLGVFSNPKPTVDAVVHWNGGIVMVYRSVKVIPEGLKRLGYEWTGPEELEGYALPGGFLEFGEDPELAAVREPAEETGLQIKQPELLGVFGNPLRDYGRGNISIAYKMTGEGEGVKIVDTHEPDLKDVVRLTIAEIENLWGRILFDHTHILNAWRVSVNPGLRTMSLDQLVRSYGFLEPRIMDEEYYRPLS